MVTVANHPVVSVSRVVRPLPPSSSSSLPSPDSEELTRPPINCDSTRTPVQSSVQTTSSTNSSI